jgi:hypothetical protein
MRDFCAFKMDLHFKMPLPNQTNPLKTHKHGSILIETGTYKGDGIRSALDAGFETVYSIELDETLFIDATKAFANDDRVHILHGDSAIELPKILNNLPDRSDITLWLDAHASGPLKYDGGTPLLSEIHAIATSSHKAAILIDDCRLLGSWEWKRVSKVDVMDALQKLAYSHKITYEDGHVPGDIMVISPM